MPIEGREESYPFPGARTMVQLPMPANAFQPKEWGVNAEWAPPTGNLDDAAANFFTTGIVGGDPIFIVDTSGSVFFASTVNFVVTATRLRMVDFFGIPNQTNVVYKVGEAALHDLQTLGSIIAQRGISAITLHFATLWTDAPIGSMARDETGEVYIIDPEEEPERGHFRINGRDYEAAAVADWTDEQWEAELEKEIIP